MRKGLQLLRDNMAKNLFVVIFALGALVFAENAASKTDKPLTPEQKVWLDCDKKSESLKRRKRKAFMAKCVSTNTKKLESPVAAAPHVTQDQSPIAATLPGVKSSEREKMKSCVRDAESRKLVGRQRMYFINNCVDQ